MRQELNLGPCPLCVRPKKLPNEVKREATIFKEQLTRHLHLSIIPSSCFLRVAKGEDFPYEVHLVYRDQFQEDLDIARYFVNNLPEAWDKEAKAALRKAKNDN